MTIDSGEQVDEVILLVNQELKAYGLKFDEIVTHSSWFEYKLIKIGFPNERPLPSMPID